MDGDGVVVGEARAVTAAKQAGSALAGAVGGLRGKAAGLMSRKKGAASLGDVEGDDASGGDTP